MKKILALILVILIFAVPAAALNTANHYNGSIELPEVSVDDINNSNITKGDINNDGKINNKDVVALFRYVSTSQTGANMKVYDFNDDGKLNNKDVVALFRYVLTK